MTASKFTGPLKNQTAKVNHLILIKNKIFRTIDKKQFITRLLYPSIWTALSLYNSVHNKPKQTNPKENETHLSIGDVNTKINITKRTRSNFSNQSVAPPNNELRPGCRNTWVRHPSNQTQPTRPNETPVQKRNPQDMKIPFRNYHFPSEYSLTTQILFYQNVKKRSPFFYLLAPFSGSKFTPQTRNLWVPCSVLFTNLSVSKFENTGNKKGAQSNNFGF